MTKPLLILDLDETLIYATKRSVDRIPDFKVFDFNVYLRPHLKEFLMIASKSYKLAIWSSAGDEYVIAIVDKIPKEHIPFEFIWGRSKAVKRMLQADKDDINYDNESEYIKPLKKVKKLGYKIEKVLIVDDSPHKSKLNYGNAIYPKAYKGESDDEELIELSKYLEKIKNISNFRTLEKRDWKKYDQ